MVQLSDFIGNVTTMPKFFRIFFVQSDIYNNKYSIMREINSIRQASFLGSLIISIYDSICFLDSPCQDVGTKSVKMQSDITLGNEKNLENPWVRSCAIQIKISERRAINCI